VLNCPLDTIPKTSDGTFDRKVLRAHYAADHPAAE
jgi:hypothetical protein